MLFGVKFTESFVGGWIGVAALGGTLDVEKVGAEDTRYTGVPVVMTSISGLIAFVRSRPPFVADVEELILT